MGTGPCDPYLRKVPRLGINCKIGDLMRLAGACINDGVCGLIRQYTGHLTKLPKRPPTGRLSGTAWLSTARAAGFGVKSSNERNPRWGLFAPTRCTSSQYGLLRLGDTRATRGGDRGLRCCNAERFPKTPHVRSAACKGRMKVKSLVIANNNVAVKCNQALHTPPITLEKGLWRYLGAGCGVVPP